MRNPLDYYHPWGIRAERNDGTPSTPSQIAAAFLASVTASVKVEAALARLKAQRP